MPDDYKTLANPLMKGIKLIAERPVPDPKNITVPSDIEIISADNHFAVTEDIFYENFPAHLKDKAPRIWFDAYWRIGQPGGRQSHSHSKAVTEAVIKVNLHEEAWDHAKRRAHLRAEGITKEIAFPQFVLGYQEPDHEVRGWIWRIYNEYIAEQHKKNPDFYGVGLCSRWEPENVEESVKQISDLDLKTVLLPLSLRDPAGKPMNFADPSMDRFWAIVNEAKLPFCFHIGEPIDLDGPGAMATITLLGFAPFRRPISQLVFGNVFDKFPDLKIVFAEGGIAWALPWLQDAEMLYDTYNTVIEPTKMRPSDYWRKHCHATFQSDALGLSHLDVLGAENVMWAVDYPHGEGTFGISQQQTQSIVDQIGAEDAKLVLGGNAKRVFNL